MQEYFTVLGYHVDCTRELAEAQALLGQTSYAVVIGDLRLTGSAGNEGLALVDDIRQRHLATRVIILTAYGSPQTEQEARRPGGGGVLAQAPVALGDRTGGIQAPQLRGVIDRTPYISPVRNGRT
jgi:DNA-binding NtrC family response regulator